MKNFRLTFALLLGVSSMMMLNSCSSSRGFEGYYPENRITGKGYGYNNVEQPAGNVETTQEEVVVATETTAPAEEATTTETTVATTAPTTVLPQIDMTQLSEREQKWMNRLGLNKMVDPNAAPKKMGFMQRMTSKMISKIAMRQMKKHFGSDMTMEQMDKGDIFAIVAIASAGAAYLWLAGLLFGLVAIVFGVLALKNGTSRRGMAIAAICLGAFAWLLWLMYAFLVLWVVF